MRGFMSFQGRAFYNLLSMNLCDEHYPHHPWQIKNYRELKTSELFEILRIEELHVDLDVFLLYSEKCDSPEEIANVLVEDQEDEERLEKVYLVVFELWRRFCREKESLSVFCDELDHQIFQYDQIHNNVDQLQELIDQLQDILYQNTKEGENPKDVFIVVSEFLAHDLEEFIYDFSADLLDEEEGLYVSEIIDGFYDYIEYPLWFDFLRVRVVALADPLEATTLLQLLVEKVEEQEDLDLYFEILKTLSYEEEIPLFNLVFEKIEPLLHQEEDFQDLLEIMKDYFSSLDKEEEEKKVDEILKQRNLIDPQREFSSSEQDFQELKKLLATIAY